MHVHCRRCQFGGRGSKRRTRKISQMDTVMTRDFEGIRQRLGTEAPPIEYFIDEGSIRYFANSLMYDDLDYRGSQTARPPIVAAVVAPATFFGSAIGVRDIPAGDERTMSALYLPFPTDWVRLATGDEFEFYSPVMAGMTLVCRERLVDMYEKYGRSGRLVFYSIEKTFQTRAGEPVLRRVLHCVAREPATEPRNRGQEPRAQERAAGATAIPSLVVGPITVRYLAMFATATAEFVDIHYDADYARSLGLAGPIIQGLYKTAIIARMLTHWTGDVRHIRKICVQHRGMDIAGSVLTAGGATIRPGSLSSKAQVDCRVWVKNQDGIITTFGTACVAQPPCDNGQLMRTA
jgi:acyl dehydratase